jgi:hypothetical protein
MRRAALIGALLTALAVPAGAGAEIQPGNVPAETPQTAYPSQPGLTYQGAFDNSRYWDFDYFSFTVANAGETIEFTLQNTTQVCRNDPDSGDCRVYMTLTNASENAIDPSASGTWAPYADTESLDWTVAAPGTYYIQMLSEGDTPAGEPSYAVSYRVVSAGGGTGGPGGPSAGAGAALVRSLRVFPHQRGAAVRSTVTLGQWARSVRVTLLAGGSGKTIATLARGPLGPGRHRFVVALPSAYQRMLRARTWLGIKVRIRITGVHGSADFTRRVVLTA